MTQCTALISSNFSNTHQIAKSTEWKKNNFIKHSLEIQIADSLYLCHSAMRNVLIERSVSIIRSHFEPGLSVQMVLFNAQNLAAPPIRRFISDKNPHFLSRQVAILNTFSLEDLYPKRDEIAHLFYHILRPCEYDRAMIAPRSALESLLDQEMYRAHKTQSFKDPVTNRKVHVTVLETLFARRLGIKPEQTYSEYHAVYYLLDRERKRLGVFKPSIQIDPLKDQYGSSEDREAHLAEAANSKIDQFFKTNLVPYTQLLRCGLSSSNEETPIVGSFQFYVEDACDLFSQLEGKDLFDIDHDSLALRLDVFPNRELELRNFEDFAFFDLFTANNDHHFKNILLKKVAKKIWEMVAIDNANSFPWCHDLDLPHYKMHPNHWFKWSALPHAKKPFSNAIIARINTLEINQMEQILREVLISRDVPSSQEHFEGKISTLRDRFNCIKHLAHRKAL